MARQEPAAAGRAPGGGRDRAHRRQEGLKGLTLPKPDPALLDPARYPFSCLIEPRFGDLDVNMHVNNVALTGLLEEGRVRFHNAARYRLAVANATSLVASLSVEFLGEAFHPDPLEIRCAIAHIGRSSQTLAQIVRQNERPVAFAQSVIVCVQDGTPAPLPDGYRESAQDWMLRP